jgi:hypothetical protein
MYGVYPLSKAQRPDSEEPVITADGKKICQRCAAKYRQAKEEAEIEQGREHGKEAIEDGRIHEVIQEHP